MVLLVRRVLKGNGEVAAVLQHLKLPRVTPLLAGVHADDGFAAVEAHCKSTHLVAVARPEGDAGDIDLDDVESTLDGDVDV